MENQSHRLILIPPPFQGHMTPMLQLGTILHSKGFSITVAHTHFNSPNPSNHPNFSFIPFFDGLSDTYMISSTNFIDITSTLNTNCASPLKELLVHQMTKAKVNHEKIACIIYDGLMYFTDSVAKELKLPSIVFRTTSATNVLTYHTCVHLQSNGYLPLQAKSLAVTPSLGVIFNTVDCLEGPSLDKLHELYKVSLFPIGPLHMVSEDSSSNSSLLQENHSCITWLNNQARKSVLYVSLGSIASWDEKELTEVAWGLANSKQNFLWDEIRQAVSGCSSYDALNGLVQSILSANL
ncbi:UDP-glucuronosyl/UDP-glucosyltransferase [Sesbania bispinosa]|nr:UDP-glucuronosyl/UDP-glucosyltransferase [Sesbania bispinosa]